MDNSVIDLIISIKNGYMAKKESIESSFTRFKQETLKRLKDLGYVQDYSIIEARVKKVRIKLLYKDGVAALTDVKIFSKPGRRYYVSYKDLKLVLGGLGFSLISTPYGVLTNYEARKRKVGGELLFSIW